MKKMLFAFLVVISSSLTTLGQTTSPPATACQLTASQAPQVRGLRLGMSLDEFLALFPGSRVEFADQLASFEIPQRYGINGINVYQLFRFGGDAFKGVSFVQAAFVDKKLGDFRLSYQNTLWANIDEFIDKLGEFFSLPKASTWSIGARDENSVNKIVRCIGVELSAGIQKMSPESQGSSLGITVVPTPTEQWSQRKKEADAKAAQAFKQTFKP
jgi:hypothetical protein